MRAWLVMLVACGGSPPQTSAPPAAAPPLKRDLAVAEPVPKQPTPPEEPALDPNDPSSRDAWLMRGTRQRPVPVERRRLGGPAPENDFAESDFWSHCVKEYVQAQPEHARRPLTAAFARYVVSCDASQHVVIEPPREYRGKPYVAFRGVIGGEMIVEFATCNAAAIENVAIVFDGKRWVASTLDVERRDGCTIARVPDTRALRRALRDAIDANRAAVDFDGDELPITDEVERDLRLMLDALSAP